MKWISFAILAVLTSVLQTTLVAHTLAIGEIRPDWMFILAVHYALHGKWPDVAIAAWEVCASAGSAATPVNQVNSVLLPEP